MARPATHPLRLIFRALALTEERGLNYLSELGLISDEVLTVEVIAPKDVIRALAWFEETPGRWNQLWIINLRLHYAAGLERVGNA